MLSTYSAEMLMDVNKEFAFAGSLDELKAKGRLVLHGDHRPILVVYDRGRVFALDNRCPHMGFPLERGSVEDGILTCHWHHARFDLESGCTFDLWADDVPKFPVELRDGEVWVKTTVGHTDPAAHWRQRLADGLAHDLGLVIAKAVHGQLAADVPAADIVRQVALFAQSGTYPGVALKHWNQLTPYQQKAFAHEMEVYAAYLAETDYEIGRVVQAFKDAGRYDNTIIIYIHGDNGASAEGTPEGTPSEVADFNTHYPTVEEYGPKYLDKWGSEFTDPHYPVGWAWALDTPFKWSKQVPAYFGGTMNGMVVSWPGHINDPGGIRTQFHHVIDIVPTILEATGIVEPDMVDGVKQNPIEGVSLAYTFDKASANAPSTHHSQYFEMFGDMGMYSDGWIASTDPFAIPWLLLSNKPIEDVWSKANWRLYHVTEDDDWTQNTDVKEKYPDKLKELQDLFVTEAQKNNVFPLNNTPLVLDARTSLIGSRSTTVYHPGIVALDTYDTPNILNNDYSIGGDVTVGTDGGNGVIVANGGRFGGYSLWVNHGVPMFSYNLVMMDMYRWKGPKKLTPGPHQLRFSFVYDGGGLGKGGLGTLSVDGRPVDSHRIPSTICCTLVWFEGLDVGGDYSTPVDDQYKVPNNFSGTIAQVVFNTSPMKLTVQQKTEFLQRLDAAGRGIQ